VLFRSELDHQAPAAAGVPLSAFPELAQNETTGFRFVSIGVQAWDALNPSASGGGLLQFTESGCYADQSSGAVSCAKPNRNLVALSGFDPHRDVVVIDVARLFERVDLARPNACFDDAVQDCPGLMPQLGLDADSGMAIDTQRIYSVAVEATAQP
jgi:hypothetical protein